MSELTGKTQRSGKDYEILYVEEKAPEPWIQRESFYNKDLPTPEDDDERLSDAKHIGSFMVPSPLMRLKTPSSISSFNCDRSEDGKISPIPSLDRSIKSERRDSDTSLAISKSGLGSVESLPQLYGLFDDSKVSIKEGTIFDEDIQDIEGTPIASSNVNIYEDSPNFEKNNLDTAASGIADERLGLASLMTSEVLVAKHEGLKNVNSQEYDPASDAQLKYAGQGAETAKFGPDIVGKGHLNLSTPRTTKEIRQSGADLSDNSRNPVKITRASGNLAEGSMNESAMDTGLDVAGSSEIVSGTPVIVASTIATGPSAVDAGTSKIISESSVVAAVSSSITSTPTDGVAGSSAIATGSSAVAAGLSAITPSAALGAAGMLFSHMSDHEIMSQSSGSENFATDQGEDFISKGDDSAGGFGNAFAKKMKFTSGHDNFEGNQRKDLISREPDTNFGLEYGDIKEGNLHAENLQFDDRTAKYVQQEHKREYLNNLSEPRILSSVGGSLAEVLDEHGHGEEEMGDIIENRYINEAPYSTILCDNSASDGYGKSIPAPYINEGAQVSIDDTYGQNIQKVVGPKMDTRFEKFNTALNTNLNELPETSDINNSLLGNPEGIIQSSEAESGLRNEAKNRQRGCEASPLSDRLSSNIGIAIVTGAVPSAIGTTSEIAAGSEMVLNQSSGIYGMNESLAGNGQEATKDMITVSNEPIRDSDAETLATRDYLGGSYQSDLADKDNFAKETSSAQLEMTPLLKVDDHDGTFVSTDSEGTQAQSIQTENINLVNSNVMASTLKENEAVQLEEKNYSDNQLMLANLSSKEDTDYLENLKNEGGADQDISFKPSSLLESGADKQDARIYPEYGRNDSTRNSDGAYFETITHDSFSRMDQCANVDENIESDHIPKPLNESELDSILFAYDSLLNSEVNEVAEHLAANDIDSNDYAKEWFKSIFSGPEFSPALSEKASIIYADRGPVGLVEVTLDLIKLNSDELLALDTRNDILKKLTSNMNPDESVIAGLGSTRISPDLFSSLQNNYTNELLRNNEIEYDSKLNLLVAKCRNAEELLKQLSEIIKDMNNDINELTQQNNSKSLRIKMLEDELQKKN